MQLIAVDLGTTNIKVAVYSQSLTFLAQSSAKVAYTREGAFVEFDAEAYAASIRQMIAGQLQSGAARADTPTRITFTGQAESLVVLGENGRPLCPAISWMDERSAEECALLERRFSPEECYARTGQRAVLPTWPATKILWLRRHRPEVFAAAAHYLLLKDYIVYTLTGRMLGEQSIATFSLYFDIYQKRYWPEMLDAVGLRAEQLPPLVEPCTDAGPLTAGAAGAMGFAAPCRVNTGTLDHFAGMVGTGNVQKGTISLSTGTVMGLATIADMPAGQTSGIPMHYGFEPDSYVMLPVSESGGACLEWFRKSCLPGVSFADIDSRIARRGAPEDLLFLPYIVGTNAPEFDRDACGAFHGLRARHDAYDMACAVMEGVAHLLRKNCDAILHSGTAVERIIATGGGSKSAVWCALQANITGLPVEVPAETEAACLGAAIIGAVAEGLFESYTAAAQKVVRIARRFEPQNAARCAEKHRRFEALYQAMLAIQRM